MYMCVGVCAVVLNISGLVSFLWVYLMDTNQRYFHHNSLMRCDYNSPKMFVFIITHSRNSPENFRASWAISKYRSNWLQTYNDDSDEVNLFSPC